MSLRTRRMRFEALESRELLAVTDLAAVSSSSALVASNAVESEVEALSAALVEGVQVGAQLIQVTTALDVVDPNDGVTSLREALSQAEDGDTIRFSTALGDNVTIFVESELPIEAAVTIDGESRVTLDAGGASRIFNVVGGTAESPVALTAIALQNGHASTGGAIYNAGNLALDAVAIRNNASTDQGGAIYNAAYSTLTIENSALYGNTATRDGGAIYNAEYSALTIEASALYNNVGQLGGAVYNGTGGAVSLENVELYANRASNGGAISTRGGLSAVGVAMYGNRASQNGGAIQITAGTSNIFNATLAGNSASNGGAIYFQRGTLNLGNSVVAQNFANVSSNIYGQLDSDDANILNYSPDFVVAPYFNAKGELQNLDSVDLRLRSTSRAIDAGDARYAAQLATDLDGNDRVYGQRVDIGAYEYQGDRADAPMWSNIVDTLDDSFDLDDGQWSLREALWFAPEYAEIRFAPTLQGALSQTASFYIDAPIAIDGGGVIVIDCSALDIVNGSKEAFVVCGGDAQTRVALKNIAITNSTSRGAIQNRGALELDGVTISNCETTTYGGALYNFGDAILRNTELVGNTGSYGGAIYNTGVVHIYDSTIHDNASKSNGGAFCNLGTFVAVRSDFYDNKVKGSFFGGAAFNTADLSLENVRFYGNSTNANGGALYNNGTVNAVNTAFYGNYSGGDGGAIYSNKTATLVNCTIAGNVAARQAAGIFSYSANVRLSVYNSIVAENSAPLYPNAVAAYYRNVDNVVDGTAGFVVAPAFDAQGALTNIDALDLALRQDSRAVDAGNDVNARNAGLDADSVDLGGAPRFLGASVDIGAYEYTPAVQARIDGVTQVDKVLTAVLPAEFQATSYQWFVSDTPDGERSPIDGATGATYTISRTYYQKYITVVVDGQNGGYSCTAEATTDAIAARKLTKPALKTQVASDSIVVSWKSILRAQGYYVYYKASDDASYTYYGKVSDTQCELQGLDPSTTYSIRVKAVSSQAAYLNSDYTTIAVTTNEAVEYVGPARNVKQATTLATSIQLAWNSGENADSYRVDVYNSSRTQLLASYETTETSVKLTGLTASTAYSVDVVARSTRYGESSTVTFAAKSDAVTKLAIPTVKAAPGSTAIYASWNANKDAVAYLVYYKVASSTSAYTSYGRVYGTSVTLEGLRANTTYSIRVKAVGDNIDHSNSDFRVVEATTAPAITVLPSPENVAITNVTASTVSTQWDRVIDAQSYRVTVYNHDMTEVVVSYETTALSATLTGLDDSTSYRVAVVGVSSRYGESAAVELAFTTTEKQKLARPTVTATTTANSIAVSWTLDPEAYKYRVQYRKVGASAYVTLPDFLGDSCALDGLEPGTSYEVRVKALASGKNPEYVNSDFATVTKKTTV